MCLEDAQAAGGFRSSAAKVERERTHVILVGSILTSKPQYLFTVLNISSFDAEINVDYNVTASRMAGEEIRDLIRCLGIRSESSVWENDYIINVAVEYHLPCRDRIRGWCCGVTKQRTDRTQQLSALACFLTTSWTGETCVNSADRRDEDRLKN